MQLLRINLLSHLGQSLANILSCLQIILVTVATVAATTVASGQEKTEGPVASTSTVNSSKQPATNLPASVQDSIIRDESDTTTTKPIRPDNRSPTTVRQNQTNAPNSAVPSVRQWSQSYLAKNSNSDQGNFPLRVALVSSLPKRGLANPAALPTRELSALSYLRPTHAEDLAWSYKLNEPMLKDLNPFQSIFKASPVDTVIRTSGKEWHFLANKGGKPRLLLRTKRPTNPSNPEAFAEWFFASLGWDGVVLDQKGPYLLVGSTSTILAMPQLQALAVKGSERKFSLKQGERKGSGLLSLGDTWQGFGVFEVVFLDQGVAALPIGSKLLIERRQ